MISLSRSVVSHQLGFLFIDLLCGRCGIGRRGLCLRILVEGMKAACFVSGLTVRRLFRAEKIR